MSMAEQRHSPVYRQLEAYGESWKPDHEAAMAYRDWEDAIAVGINIFHMLREREQTWREHVFRGTLLFAEDDNRDHLARFADWIGTTREFLAMFLPNLEAQFGPVERAAKLRRCVEQAETIVKTWQPPRLATAVGQREMFLSPESALELERFIENAKANPPPMPSRRLEERDASFLKPSS